MMENITIDQIKKHNRFDIYKFIHKKIALNHKAFNSKSRSVFRAQIIGKRSLDRISLDRNCHFSVDRNFTNHLIEFFDTFHLIES